MRSLLRHVKRASSQRVSCKGALSSIASNQGERAVTSLRGRAGRASHLIRNAEWDVTAIHCASYRSPKRRLEEQPIASLRLPYCTTSSEQLVLVKEPAARIEVSRTPILRSLFAGL